MAHKLMASSGQVGDGSAYNEDKDKWGTPQALVDGIARLYDFAAFDLDAAASEHTTKAKSYYSKDMSGLTNGWYGRVWLNPPFGQRGNLVGVWLDKALSELRRHDGPTLVAALVPAKTDTVWWHKYVMGFADEVYLVRGRVRFLKPDGVTMADGPAGFGVAVAVFRPNSPHRVDPLIVGVTQEGEYIETIG